MILYDSLKQKSKTNRFQKISIQVQHLLQLWYPFYKKVIYKIVRVQQIDATSCGVFCAAYATSLALGEDASAIDYFYKILQSETDLSMTLRKHWFKVLRSRVLSPLPRNT